MLRDKDLDGLPAPSGRHLAETDVARLSHETLERLFMAATGSRTGHGARRWAAGELGVDERTVARWLAGDTRPSARMLVRLNIAARIGAARRERDAGRGWWAALRKFFAALNLEHAARVQMQEDLDRGRRIEQEFLASHGTGGAFAERDLLPGSPRAHLYRRQ